MTRRLRIITKVIHDTIRSELDLSLIFLCETLQISLDRLKLELYLDF